MKKERFDVRRGAWVKHKLHGHLCRVLGKTGRGYRVLNTKNGDQHHVDQNTLFRYYTLV